MLGLLVTMAIPTPVSACGLLDCIFGWTARVQERQAGETQRAAEAADAAARIAEVERQKAVEVERVKAQAAADLQAHETELENQRQQGLLNQAQYDAMRQIIVANVENQTAVQIKQIDANYALLAGNLDNAARIAQDGIRETGLTTRERVRWDGATGLVIIVIGGLVITYMLRGGSGKPAYYVLPGQRQGLPGPRRSRGIADSIDADLAAYYYDDEPVNWEQVQPVQQISATRFIVQGKDRP